ncbi:MAG TPA: 4Fe-4S ferredoxin [Deltaproteobacteria bacterium]|nr:4Fe-4S ferredoxin [Deltaproteobacteria bacterium]
MITKMHPYISETLCERCGECVSLCPYDVFGKEGDSVVVVSPEDCIECTACVDNCPHKAITMGD